MNARPEPDFKYFSNSKARYLPANAIAAIPQAVVFPWLSHSHVHVAVFDLASHLCNRYKVFHRNTLVCKRNPSYLSFATYGGFPRRSSLRRSEGGPTRNRTPVIGFGDRRSTIEL